MYSSGAEDIVRGVPAPEIPSEIERLVRAVEAALDSGLEDEATVEAVRPAMALLLDRADRALGDRERAPWNGQAAGHLLHADAAGRFHILSIVFPPGTSSGIHEHGCWGLIGYVQGLDEETRYRRVDGGDGADGCVLEEVDRVVHLAGEISRLLPPEESFHRVRNPGQADGVSVHVLCHLPETHPHRYWDRDRQRLLPFPFRTVDEGLIQAEVLFDEGG
jgi:predicted metal-dependent enzyme (double-stranded beta helix superfamily)